MEQDGAEDIISSGSSWIDREQDQDSLEQMPPLRRTMLITLAMFCGYAATVVMQHELQAHLKIPSDPNSPEKKAFTIAVTCQYLGNLIFRLGHNLFWCLHASQRVMLAQVAMMFSMLLLLSLFYFPLDSFALLSPVTLVIVAYLLSGLAIGTFEANCMASLAPLGPQTKLWAVVGLPLGFNLISVGGMAALSLGMPRWGVYLFVLVTNLFGLFLYRCGLPSVVHKKPKPRALMVLPVGADGVVTAAFESDPSGLVEGEPRRPRGAVREAISGLCRYLPHVFFHSVSLMIAMFGVASCTGISTNIFTAKKVPLFYDDGKSFLVDQHVFLATQNFFVFLGDSVSRKVAYMLPKHRATKSIFLQLRLLFFFIFFTAFGLFLLFQKMGSLAIAGSFLIFWGNGSVYATTTRWVDARLAAEFHVKALSFWLFVGDLGSVTGSSLIDVFHRRLCPEGVVYHNICQ